MRKLCEQTGGTLVLTDSFSMHTFRDTLLKMLSPKKLGMAAVVTGYLSPEIKFAGAVGPCKSLGRKRP